MLGPRIPACSPSSAIVVLRKPWAAKSSNAAAMMAARLSTLGQAEASGVLGM